MRGRFSKRFGVQNQVEDNQEMQPGIVQNEHCAELSASAKKATSQVAELVMLCVARNLIRSMRHKGKGESRGRCHTSSQPSSEGKPPIKRAVGGSR